MCLYPLNGYQGIFSAPAVIRTGLYAPMFGLDALTTHMRCCGDGLDEIKTAFLLFLSLVAVQRFKKDHQRHSLYSVCSGICSSAQAIERCGLDLEVILFDPRHHVVPLRVR